MGLEIARFLLALEDEFDIYIDEDSPFETETEVTVGMVVDLVERIIRARETDETGFQIMAKDFPDRVFEQTAATLAVIAGVSPKTIEQETRLTDMFTDVTRWRNMLRVKDEKVHTIDEELEYDGIEQKYKRFLLYWKISVVVLFALLCWLSNGQRIIIIVGMICYLASSVFFILHCSRSMLSRERRFPPRNQTVGQLAEAITTYRRRYVSPDGSPLSRSAIESRVIEILAESMRIKSTDITLTDRLVQDLKMG
jgi:acyl carrier protein